MSPDKPSFLRYLAGSAVGGVVAAAASALTFLVFVQFPPETSPSRHDAQAALANCADDAFCGWFYWRAGDYGRISI